MERLKAIEAALKLLEGIRQKTAGISPGAYAFLVRVTDRLSDEHRELFKDEFYPAAGSITAWASTGGGQYRVLGDGFIADIARTAGGTWFVKFCNNIAIDRDEVCAQFAKLVGGAN